MIKPRSIKIKAWNIEDRLIRRLRQVDCVQSALYKEGHILLQYTGMEDQNGVEIYDGDILLYQHCKHITSWDEVSHQWIRSNQTNQVVNKLTSAEARQSLRLCHFFESGDFSDVN